MNSYDSTAHMHHYNSNESVKHNKVDPPSLRHMGPTPPQPAVSSPNYYPTAMHPQTSPAHNTPSPASSRLQHPSRPSSTAGSTGGQSSSSLRNTSTPIGPAQIPNNSAMGNNAPINNTVMSGNAALGSNSSESQRSASSQFMNSPAYEPPAIQLNNQSRAKHALPASQHAAPASQTTTSNTHIQSSTQKTKSKSKAKSKKKSSSQQNAAKNYEVDTNLNNSIFDAPNRTMTPMFNPSQSMGPPSMRGQSNDGPTYLPSNLFPSNPGRPLSAHSTTPLHHKSTTPAATSNMPDMSQMSAAFNPLFGGGQAGRSQNGLNPFQPPGFHMNTVGGHGGMSSSAANMAGMTTGTPHMSNNMMAGHHMPHSAAHHMGNFTNFFEMNQVAADAAGLNISPIKFPGAPNHHQTGMPMESHHQALYQHNRAHLQHPMSFNNILAHNPHHGFDARTNPMGHAGMGMGTPFGGPHGTPTFGMPHINFSMHEH